MSWHDGRGYSQVAIADAEAWIRELSKCKHASRERAMASVEWFRSIATKGRLLQLMDKTHIEGYFAKATILESMLDEWWPRTELDEPRHEAKDIA